MQRIDGPRASTNGSTRRTVLLVLAAVAVLALFGVLHAAGVLPPG